MITAERLRELLNYDPETGVFTWRVNRPRAKAGDIAGCIATKKDGRKYIIIRISQQNYYAHRLAVLWMTGEWPTDLMDHRRGNGLDNRWSEIRPANHSQNVQNRVIGEGNTSGYIGVHPDGRGLWRSQIAVNGERKTLGTFDTAEEAARAHDYEAYQLHGEFATLNFPNEVPSPYTARKVRRDSSSPYRGVHAHKNGRFNAYASVDGKVKHLGYFDTPEEAARVRDRVVKEVYGKDAVLNFPC